MALLSGANAQTLAIARGGFDQAQGCSSVGCDASQTFELNPTAPLAIPTGSLQLDTTLLTLSLQTNVPSLSLTGIGGVPDNGFSEVLFLNTLYQAVALSLLETAAATASTRPRPPPSPVSSLRTALRSTSDRVAGHELGVRSG